MIIIHGQQWTTDQLSAVYRAGDRLRPIPPKKECWSGLWDDTREFLFAPWFLVQKEVPATAQTRLLDDHMWQGDELMDPVAEMFVRLGPVVARGLFEQALVGGIDSVTEAPPELRALFAVVEEVPAWYRAEAAQRGRVRLNSASMMSGVITAGFAIFDTVLSGDVSAATGATGRFKRDGYRRLVETNKYFSELFKKTQAGPGTEAYKVTLRVRLVHALTRRGLNVQWGEDHFVEFGNPISNSYQSAFIQAMLALLLIDHRLGRPCSLDELEDAWQYLRYWSWLMGVADELVAPDVISALRCLDYLLARNGWPSEHRVDLTVSLLGGAPKSGGLAASIPGWVIAPAAHTFLGGKLARIFYAGTPWEAVNHERIARLTMSLARPVVRLGKFRDRIPGVLRVRELTGFGSMTLGFWLSTKIMSSETYRRFTRATNEAAQNAGSYTLHDANTNGGEFKPSGHSAPKSHSDANIE